MLMKAIPIPFVPPAMNEKGKNFEPVN